MSDDGEEKLPTSEELPTSADGEEKGKEEQSDDYVVDLSLAAFIADRHTPVPLVAPIGIRRDSRDGLRMPSRMKRSGSSKSPFSQRWI